jgi:enoyl-[acyl-carrier protein] reductase III
MFDRIRSDHGRLDVFVSNAARTSFRPAMQLTARTWQKIMDINARAFLLGSQLAAELMREGDGGRIIGISSLGSRFAVPEYSGLGAAKAIIETLTRYLAVELAPWGINVNVVCGGFVDTASMRLAPDYRKLVDHLVATTPAGRLAQPEDLAGVVAFLCSSESDWIRGQTLVADGGYSLELSYRR